MNDESFDQIEEEKPGLLKRIIIWIIVLFISLMMIAVVIFQPKFFSFVS